MSEPISAVTLEDAIVLKRGEADVEGTLEYDEKTYTLRFSPKAALLPLTEYTYSLSPRVADMYGNRLASPYVKTFVSRDLIWQAAKVIDQTRSVEEAAESSWVNASVAPDGSTMVMWKVIGRGMFSNVYDAKANRWGGLHSMGTRNADNSSSDGWYSIAKDKVGNALILWSQSAWGGSAAAIWSRRFNFETGWGDAQNASVLPFGYADPVPSMVLYPDGTALAVWSKVGTLNPGDFFNTYTLVYSTYSPESGWTVAQNIDGARPRGNSIFGIASDGNGNSLVYWDEFDRDTRMGQVKLLSRKVGGGWRPVEAVLRRFSPPITEMFKASLADDGTVSILWSERKSVYFPSVLTVHASHRSPGGEWTEPVDLQLNTTVDARMVDLFVDHTGRTHAFWTEHHSGGYGVALMHSTRPPEGEWLAPKHVGASALTNRVQEGDISAAMDGLGNVSVTWSSRSFGADPEHPNNHSTTVLFRRWKVGANATEGSWESIKRIHSLPVDPLSNLTANAHALAAGATGDVAVISTLGQYYREAGQVNATLLR